MTYIRNRRKPDCSSAPHLIREVSDMAELLVYPNHPGNYGMTAWERLERYGSIQNFRRKDDPQIYNAYLVAGMIKVVRATREISVIEVYPREYTMTIDTFLWLFLRNLPCGYPQYIKSEVC